MIIIENNLEMNVLQYKEGNDILRFIINNGMIDISDVQNSMESMKREELLSKHQYKIWQGKDGKWYTYLPDKEKGRKLIKRKILSELEDLVIAQIKEDEENPTITEIFNEWNDRKLELKKICNATHSRNKRFFYRHYEEFGKKRIKSVTENMMLEFLEEQIPKYNLTAKGFGGLLGVTKGFLKYAKKKGLVDFYIDKMINDMDLTDSSFNRTIKEDYQEVFNDDEMNKLVTYLIDNFDTQNMGLLLLFFTGIRVGELAALKHSDFHDDSIDIRRTETICKDSNGINHYEVKEFPKTAVGVRTIVVPSDYLWLLRKIKVMNPFGEYAFVNNSGKRMTTCCFRSRLYRVCKKLGIYNKSPHKIRKTYGSILLDNNVDKRFIIKQMGHADILCTETKYHRDRREHDEKMEIISNIPQFKAQ